MNLLTRVLIDPSRLTALSARQLGELRVQAHSANLLGRIDYLAQREGIVLPPRASWHFSSFGKVADRQRALAIQTIIELKELFDWLEVEWVLLKGAAYISHDLPPARGRTFADIDILVPKADLNRVERQLRMRHWVRADMDEYDDHYYREWMHEIPPLRHAQRGTVLDIHHNILPLTSRDTPDITKFEKQKVNIDGCGDVQTLSNTDLCIHAAVHLFSESEYQNGLRDLSDIDLLLRTFSESEPDFTQQLLTRAKSLGLEAYVLLALRYGNLILDTPLSLYSTSETMDEQKSSTERDAGARGVRGTLLDACYRRIFTPNHSSCRAPGHGLATLALYCRGHWLRMPPIMLAKHLLRKTVRRINPDQKN